MDPAIRIRKFESENGKTFLTKRGITLILKQWVELCTHRGQIYEATVALKQGKEHRLLRHLCVGQHRQAYCCGDLTTMVVV